jgi:hypothetical protein
VQVGCGELHSQATGSDGTAWAWGWNHKGQLGDSTTTDRLGPAQVHNLSGVVQVAGGEDHTLALVGPIDPPTPTPTPAGPRVTSFKINNGAATAASRNVRLNNACTGKPKFYKASEKPTLTGATWKTCSTKPLFQLSAGKGVKTVYFRVKDAQGRTSPIVSDTIKR